MLSSNKNLYKGEKNKTSRHLFLLYLKQSEPTKAQGPIIM